MRMRRFAPAACPILVRTKWKRRVGVDVVKIDGGRLFSPFLGTLTQLLRFSLHGNLQEILNCVRSVVQHDPSPEVSGPEKKKRIAAAQSFEFLPFRPGGVRCMC